MWIILILRMVFPFAFENIPSVVHISMDESIFEPILIEEGMITTGFSSELSQNVQGWSIQGDDLFLLLWFVCAIILGMYILAKNIKFHNDIKKEPLLTNKKILALLEECKKRMKVRTPLEITLTCKIKSPALFGYIKPRLLLPVGVIEKLDYAELSYIFMHELGHLKRHDIGISWIMTFLQIFQWFNPLVWLAFHQMRIDQESACDASVLSRIKRNHKIEYASTIVGFLESFCQNRKLPAMVGILENRAQIKKRIIMIVNYRRYSKMMRLFSTTLLIVIGVLFFSFASFAKVKHEQAGIDSLAFQPIVNEDPVNPVVQDVGVKYGDETVKVTGNIQDAPLIFQGEGEGETSQVESDKKIPIAFGVNNGANIKKRIRAVESAKVSRYIPITFQEKSVEKEKAYENSDSKSRVALIHAKDFDTGSEKKTDRSAENDDNVSIASQRRIIKDKINSEKTDNKTKIVLADVPDINIKDKKETVLLKDGIQEESVKGLKPVKETITPFSDTNLFRNYYAALTSKKEQLTEVTSPSIQKTYVTSEEKNKNNLGLAKDVNYIEPQNQNNLKDIPAITEDISYNNVHDMKEYDVQPKIVSYSPPVYPFKARAKGIEGRVLLRFIVDKDGNIKDPQVVSAIPEGVFEQAALNTLIKYKLKPAMKDGKNVNSIVKLAISFSLNDNYLRFAKR